jgi:hypothetical protein
MVMIAGYHQMEINEHHATSMPGANIVGLDRAF